MISVVGNVYNIDKVYIVLSRYLVHLINVFENEYYTLS